MADFSVVAKLIADSSAFTKGVGEAKDAINNLPKSASQAMNQVGKGMASVGKGMTTFITAPVVAGVTAAIKSYADLEQAIGGIETLFKGSASTVISNSESAYKRAGVSGVDYMEQVTSFSATLLQGLGGDTVKAAEYADKAIVDMSDNANKFGTNIGEIQRAYQGFAKDNFTMLDNLKLGYGGTAGEMARLVNESGVLNGEFEATAENVKDIPFDVLIEAIHQTQKELGVTGTTAIEASETVSGSFGSMIAAAQNLVAGFGHAEADIGQLMADLGETIKIFASNIKRVLDTMWDNLPLKEWQKWVGLIVVSAGPILFIFGKLISALSQVGMAVKILGAVFTFLTSPIGLVIAAIMAVVGVIIYLWNTNEEFRTAITEIWNGIVETAIMLWNQLKSSAETIWGAIQETWEAVWEDIQILWDGFKGLFDGDWSAFWESIRSVGEDIWNVITGAWNAVLGVFTAVFGFFKGLFTGDWSTFWDGISQAADGIWQALSGLWQTFTGNLQSIWEGAKALLDGDWQGFWESIKTVASGIWDNLKELWSQVKTNIGETWSGIKDSMSDWGSHWETLKTTAQEIWDSIVEAVRAWFTNITTAITEAMPGVTEAWGAIWESFTEVAQAIWDGIVESVGGFMGNIQDKIAEIGESIAEAWNTFWGGLGEKASGAWDNISEGWNNFWGNSSETTNTGSAEITSTVDGMSGQVIASTEAMNTGAQSSVAGMNSAIVGEVAGMATGVMTESEQIESAKKFFEGLRIASVGAFSVMGSQINLSYSNTKQSIVRMSSSMESETTAKYKTLASNIKSNMQDIQSNMRSSMNTIKSTMQSGFNSVRSVISSAMTSIVTNIRSSMSGAVSAMNSAAGQARSAGANMGRGFQSGLASTAGSIYATARSIANNAARIMRSALRIKSPSRVTEEIGSYTGEGFVVGLENMIRPASKAAKNLALSGIPDIDSNSITGELNRLTGGNLNAGYTFNGGTLSINQQPATIHLNMGGHEWSAFTNDISQTQQAELRLENY